MSVLHIRECSFSTTPFRHSSHFAVNSSIYSVVVCSWLSFTWLFTPYCLIAGPSAFIDALPSPYALAPIPECTEARPQAAWTATAAAATSALASTLITFNTLHSVCLSVFLSTRAVQTSHVATAPATGRLCDPMERCIVAMLYQPQHQKLLWAYTIGQPGRFLHTAAADSALMVAGLASSHTLCVVRPMAPASWNVQESLALLYVRVVIGLAIVEAREQEEVGSRRRNADKSREKCLFVTCFATRRW